MIQMYIHHSIVLLGTGLSIYMTGFIGSVDQISFLTEGSTQFVNLRQILCLHKQEGKPFYVFNGIMMGISFYVFRIVFYHYVIWGYALEFTVYRAEGFWDVLYPEPFMSFIAKVSIVLYFMLFLLQLFWFSKIFAGILKAIGAEALFPPEKKSSKKSWSKRAFRNPSSQF